MIKKAAVYSLIVILMTSNLMAVTTINNLNDVTMTQNVTLLAPISHAELPNYLFLDPDTELVLIEPQPKSFSKEAATFKSHRMHYVAFWGLFFLMRGTRWSK